MADRIESRARFTRIRYANCWEDADVLCAALEPRPGKRILSIASGGDNSLALAAEGAEVVAADLSPAQLACVELKIAAVRRLEHPDLLGFLGVSPADNRDKTYHVLMGELSEDARDFWDAHPGEIGRGIVHAGRFERYFRVFRKWVLPLVHRRRAVEDLLAEKDAGAREEFYETRWNTWRWRLLFRVFFSRFVMGRLGRDPEFFRYVSGSVAERIMERARYALTVLPTHANPYLHYILNGNFAPALPRYLRPEKFEAVRAGAERLTLFRGPIEEAAKEHRGGGFDGFNLSDVFEYLSPELCSYVYPLLLDSALPGSRLAYWNMLAPRRCPKELASRVNPLEEEAAGLFERDLAFFYSAFVLEEVAR
ncbi:MAG: BtaA family protein [Planctomycetota bacterium]